MVAYMVGADHAVDSGMFEACADLWIHAGEYDMYTFAFGSLDEELEVVEAGGVDEGDFSHPDNPDFRRLGHGGAHEFVEFCGDTEEERSVDFVDAYALGDV